MLKICLCHFFTKLHSFFTYEGGKSKKSFFGPTYYTCHSLINSLTHKQCKTSDGWQWTIYGSTSLKFDMQSSFAQRNAHAGDCSRNSNKNWNSLRGSLENFLVRGSHFSWGRVGAERASLPLSVYLSNTKGAKQKYGYRFVFLVWACILLVSTSWTNIVNFVVFCFWVWPVLIWSVLSFCAK